MKILCLGDLHISGKNPIARLDNLVETQFKKLEEVVNISNKYNLPIVQVGDFFDSPVISYSIYSAVSRIFNKLVRPLFTLYGNHDLLYHSVENCYSTTLGALLSAHMKILHINEFSDTFPYKQPSFCDWDTEIVRGESNILLSHRAVIPTSMYKKQWMAQATNDFWIVNHSELKYFEIFICGHYHKQYFYKKNGKLIINPGTLIRRSISEDEISHTPSLILLDTKTMDYDILPLKSAKPVDEVISDKHLEMSKLNKNIKSEIQEFIKSIKVGRTTGVNFLKHLIKYLNSENIEPEIKNSIKEDLAELYGNKIEIDTNAIKKFKLRSF